MLIEATSLYDLHVKLVFIADAKYCCGHRAFIKVTGYRLSEGSSIPSTAFSLALSRHVLLQIRFLAQEEVLFPRA
jgi:hypothetical protein